MSEKRGCFKTGCLGCLGTGGAVVLVVLILVLLGLMTGGREDRMVPIEVARDLPGGVPVVPPGQEPVGDGTPQAPALLDRPIEVAEPGRVVLDLDRGSFEVVSGPAEDGVRVEGRYNEGRFELEESLESYGETGWIYRVRFDQKGFGLRPFVVHDETENRVRVILPEGVPISLEGRVGIGQSEMRLGGLWLVDVDLEIGIGEHAVRFEDPLRVPMGRLKLDTSIGVLDVEGVGNASPSDVWIKHSAGETHVDLRGAWRRDAEGLVSCGIGQCDVRLPHEVHVDLDGAGVMLGESRRAPRRDDAPPGAPRLKLSVSGSIGELSVR